MSPLSFVLTIASVLFLFFAIDGMQRRKFHFLHFLVFFGGAIIILIFIFIPGAQQWFGKAFGVARGADLVVYLSLIVLWYFYFELLHEVTKQKSQTTRLITAEAIRASGSLWDIQNKSPKDSFVFLVRAWNEGNVIKSVLKSILEKWFTKIIVVNDGSVDNTTEVVQNLINKTPNATIVLLSHIINRGWWAANKTWFSYIQKYTKELNIDWVVTYDADGQMDINDMDVFMSAIREKKNQGIIAYLWSRFIWWASHTNMPTSRRIILWGSKIITLLFNRLNVTDPHNGYRVLHASVIPKLYITSDGMMYASELLDSIRIFDIPYREIPVNIKYTDYSLWKGQKNRNALRILGELIYKKVFYK